MILADRLKTEIKLYQIESKKYVNIFLNKQLKGEIK